MAKPKKGSKAKKNRRDEDDEVEEDEELSDMDDVVDDEEEEEGDRRGKKKKRKSAYIDEAAEEDVSKFSSAYLLGCRDLCCLAKADCHVLSAGDRVANSAAALTCLGYALNAISG